MSGEIFISYRRDESSGFAGRIYDGLSGRFGPNQIFIDVDNVEPGVDFVEAIEASVSSCDALIAVIGKRWLASADEEGNRRLDNPEDFVRLEIGAALRRSIRVIPVLVDGALMPRSSDLPDDLKPLARRNALEVSHIRFSADLGRLVAALERALERADAERKPRAQPERLQADEGQRADVEPMKAGQGLPPVSAAPQEQVSKPSSQGRPKFGPLERALKWLATPPRRGHTPDRPEK